MPQEIEYKYLVRLEDWKPTTAGVLYRQGYLSSIKERVVRVRIAGEQAYLTIKGLMRGVTRLEFEYAIPVPDAATMLDLLCEHPLIEKTRLSRSFRRQDLGNRCLPRRQRRARRRRGGSHQRVRTRPSTAVARARSVQRSSLPQFQPHQQPLQKLACRPCLICGVSSER